MHPFAVGHATHPDWRMALALAAAQLDARDPAVAAATLGLVYFSDAYAEAAPQLWEALQQRWPGLSWAGCVGVGVAAHGVEYFDEPALVLMLGTWPRTSFRVFSGTRPLPAGAAHTALVHADAQTPELAELIHELAGRTTGGYLFGGLAASRRGTVHIADGLWQGGLSGVAFDRSVGLVSRVTQGCLPIGPARRLTACSAQLAESLDGRPALQVLLDDLGLPAAVPAPELVPRLRRTLVGLLDADQATSRRSGAFGPDVRVRHLLGVDPARQAVAVGDRLEPGMRLAFCRRDVDAARRDLVRICSEVREELESPEDLDAATHDPSSGRRRAVAGALYVSCLGRGGPHFGGPSAELRVIRQALGDVPLVGFFAGGEVAHHHLYGYTGVLTVFTGEA